MYVVSTVGETETLPDATGVDVPTLLSIEKVAAFVVVQESEDESPEFMTAGFAESVQASVGGGVVVTVTVAVQVTVPPAPVAVPV